MNLLRALLTATLLLMCATSSAQTAARDPGVDLRIGSIVSIQPKGYDGTGGPYLTNSLEGTVPGFTAGLNLSSACPALLTIELSSTTNLKALQSGRLIAGPSPIEATHRDTILSLLPGIRIQGGRASVEAKAGVSFLFGTPQRERYDYDDPAGVIALTVGGDVVVPIADRVALVPTFRYSFADRGDNAFYFGLGDHITRVGLAVQFRVP